MGKHTTSSCNPKSHFGKIAASDEGLC